MTTTKTRRAPRRTAEERAEEAKLLHDRLTAQVTALADSDAWKSFLRLSGVARNRSLNNQLLILSQLPTATICLGYRQWEQLGRHVIKGQRSISIFGFSRKTVTETDEAGEENTRSWNRYPVLRVFDISQTEGDDLPVTLLEGDDDAGIFDRVAEVLRGRGWDVALEEISTPGLNGYTRYDTRAVRVNATLSPAQRAKTLLHEAGHATLHTPEDTATPIAHRGQIETEAESVAYALGSMLGIDTSAWSIGYVATWSDGDVDLIRATAANVQRAVADLGDALLGENPIGAALAG